jgi:hypothetical protein
VQQRGDLKVVLNIDQLLLRRADGEEEEYKIKARALSWRGIGHER